MRNDLVVIDRIANKLREPRKEVVFPLSPTHRKELRDLKSKNVGDIIEQLRSIRKLKEDEFVLKHTKGAEKLLSEIEKNCNALNRDWLDRLRRINEIISDRKEIEKRYNLEYMDLHNDYGDIDSLKEIEETKRKFVVEKENVMRKILKKEFNEKYGKSFEEVQRKIDDITTKYEEAINFGDLELVKELYYIMKSSDGLFAKIRDLEV